MLPISYTLILGLFLFSTNLTPVLQVGTPTAVANPLVTIHSPHPGQVIQGVVPVRGSTDIDGFKEAELLFSYTQDTTDTWFLIQVLEQPAANSILAHWDTSLITDGDYHLRLIVILENGRRILAQVDDLRVRNYTPIETNTPLPQWTQDEQLPIETPTWIIKTTPTPLPTNPAALNSQVVRSSAVTGALIALLLFGLGFLFTAIKNLRNRTM